MSYKNYYSSLTNLASRTDNICLSGISSEMPCISANYLGSYFLNESTKPLKKESKSFFEEVLIDMYDTITPNIKTPDIKKFSEYKTIALKNLRTVLTNKKIKKVEDVLAILGNLSDNSVHSFVCKVNNHKLKKGALREAKSLIRADELVEKHEWLNEL